MKNKIIFFVLLLALITAPFAYAESSEEARLLQLLDSYLPSLPVEQQEVATEIARVVTNDELSQFIKGDDYYAITILDGKRLNPFNFSEYEVLAYGDRHGTPVRFGEHRYLGYAANKEAYTNFFFRPDFTDGIQIDQADWFPTPYENDSVKYFVNQMKEPPLEKNKFNYKIEYRENILLGFLLLAHLYPDYYSFNYEAAKDREWEKFVHILQPPSKYCWGTGRMFRKLPDQSVRYMDVPLLSFSDAALDFSVKLEKEFYQAKPGEVIETTAAFELKNGCFKPREANLKLYIEDSSGEKIDLPFTPLDPEKKIKDGKYTFKPGEKLVVKFSFTAPGAPAQIVSNIDGTFIKGVTWVELNSNDNEDSAPIVINGYDVKIELKADKTTLVRLSGGERDGAEVTALITRKDNLLEDLPVTLTLYLGNTLTFPLTLGPGGSFSMTIPFSGWETATITGEVWPVGKEDYYPADNTDSITINVNELTVPQGDSGIKTGLIHTN